MLRRLLASCDSPAAMLLTSATMLLVLLLLLLLLLLMLMMDDDDDEDDDDGNLFVLVYSIFSCHVCVVVVCCLLLCDVLLSFMSKRTKDFLQSPLFLGNSLYQKMPNAKENSGCLSLYQLLYIVLRKMPNAE